MKSITKNSSLLFISILTLAFSSCSDWEQMVNIPNTRITDSKRVVIIEEFTGTSCVNCPAGLAQSEFLLDIYPDNVILIGVHSKFLAAPVSAGQTDLRTKDAQDIEDFLGSWIAKPEAAFNRLLDSTNLTYRYGPPDIWQPILEAELKKEPKVELNISTYFEDSTRQLNVTLDVTGLEAINEPVHLHCGITESNIIADQKNNFDILFGFVHKHVLRKMLTPIPGEKFADTFGVGDTFHKVYNFTIPKDSVVWIPENCRVFAYVSLDENKKYILQAAESLVK